MTWRSRFLSWQENRWSGLVVVLALATLAFATLRLTMPHRSPSGPGTYQALAHVFVGGLLGGWLASPRANVELFYMAFFLCGVELAAFVWGTLS